EGQHAAYTACGARRCGGAFHGWCRGVGSSGSHAVAAATQQSLPAASADGRPNRRGVDALSCAPRAPPRPADSRTHRPVSRKREKEKVVIRVPNPKALVKERLKTPSHKVHRSKKAYQRREKHPRRPEE